MRTWLASLLLMIASVSKADPAFEAVHKLFPGDPAAIELKPSPIPGIKEAVVGTQVFYVTDDGDYLLAGPLVALALNRNLTDQTASAARKRILSEDKLPNKILFQAQDSEHLVTVVTNVDCGYCRAMHARLQEYLDLGISLEYVMTPSGGPSSAAYQKTAALLCASNPAAAVTQAMTGVSDTGDVNCQHKLDQHVALARSLGATTTPNIILPRGRLIRGFTDPEALLRALDAQDL